MDDLALALWFSIGWLLSAWAIWEVLTVRKKLKELIKKVESEKR
jgi:hypothetical protein